MHSYAMRWRLNRLCLITCLLAVFLPQVDTWAKPSPPPRFILVLCNGLTLDDLYSPRLPHLRDLGMSGAVGLMNTAVSGPKTDTAAILTLALGTLAPSESTD